MLRNRKAFKIFASLFFSLIIFGAMAIPALAATPSFTDIDNSPHKDAILWIAEQEAMFGYGDGRFGPNDLLLREQVTAVIGRVMDWAPGSNTSCFSDLAGRSVELAQYVCLLADYEVVNGYGNGRFGPSDGVTQLEAIVFITRAMQRHGLWPSSTLDTGIYPNVTSTMRDELLVYAAMTGGVYGSPITGNLNNPNTRISRGWAAQIIHDGVLACGYGCGG